MAGNGIGITFMPSAQNQLDQGPRQGSAEGDLGGAGSSDLGAAFKILNLRLPRVTSYGAPVPQRLLTSPGAAGVPGAMPAPAPNRPNGSPGPSVGGYDPMSAAFEALLRALSGGMAPMGAPSAPPPHITPGLDDPLPAASSLLGSLPPPQSPVLTAPRGPQTRATPPGDRPWFPGSDSWTGGY